MATLLRAALPLIKVPQHKGKCLRLEIRAGDEQESAEGETVWAKVEGDGTIAPCADAHVTTDAWGRGEIAAWIPVVLDGESRGVLVGADGACLSDCLSRLYDALWAPIPF